MVRNQPYHSQLRLSTVYPGAGPALKMNNQGVTMSVAAAVIKIQTVLGVL